MSVVLFMSMSVDGFITGPDDSLENGLGVSGDVLHAWLSDGGVSPESHRPSSGPNAAVFDEMLETGAVITGRRTFEFARGWDGDHHHGVPIFVLTHQLPDQPAPGHARYVTGVQSCVAQATEAAGDRDVMVHGAATGQALLNAGLLDGLAIQLIPVLLGQGRRLFEDLPPDQHELRLLSSAQAPGALHLSYRVDRKG